MKSITEPLTYGRLGRVDQQANSLVLEHGVFVALLVERERVLEARATAAPNSDPQPGGLGDRALRVEELADLLGALVGQCDHVDLYRLLASFSIAMASRYATDMAATDAPATPEELKTRIEAGIPGATAAVTGDGHHFNAVVSAPAFQGLSRIAQHRLVYDVFGAEVGDRIHALSIQTKASETESSA